LRKFRKSKSKENRRREADEGEEKEEQEEERRSRRAKYEISISYSKEDMNNIDTRSLSGESTRKNNKKLLLFYVIW
jgi:hypothetical protein